MTTDSLRHVAPARAGVRATPGATTFMAPSVKHRYPFAVKHGALLLLLGCSSLEPSGTPFEGPAVSQGLQIALECGARHRLPLVNPPGTLRFYLSSDLETADWVVGRRIWVDSRLAGEGRVFAHAALHGLFGLPGGPSTPHPPIFAECRLWPL
jgi:hypothetical protein